MREAREALKLKKNKICWPGKILKNGWSSSWSDSCPKSRPSCRVWQPAKAALAREREQLKRQAEARDMCREALSELKLTLVFGLNLYMIDHDRIWIEGTHLEEDPWYPCVWGLKTIFSCSIFPKFSKQAIQAARQQLVTSMNRGGHCRGSFQNSCASPTDWSQAVTSRFCFHKMKLWLAWFLMRARGRGSPLESAGARGWGLLRHHSWIHTLMSLVVSLCWYLYQSVLLFIVFAFVCQNFHLLFSLCIFHYFAFHSAFGFPDFLVISHIFMVKNLTHLQHGSTPGGFSMSFSHGFPRVFPGFFHGFSSRRMPCAVSGQLWKRSAGASGQKPRSFFWWSDVDVRCDCDDY